MSNGIRISAFILSAILISSCATDKIRYTQLDCKTQKARFHTKKNIPVHAKRSNNRQYASYVNQTTWSKKLNSHFLKSIIKNDKHSKTLTSGFGETKSSGIKRYSGIKETIYLQHIQKSPEISLEYSGLRNTPYLSQLNNEKEDVIKNPSSEDFNSITYSNNLLNNKKVDDIALTELNDKTGVLILNPLKPDQMQETPSHRNGYFILIMMLIAGLIPLAAIKAWPDFARNISFWAAINPWKTRFMFTGIHLGLATSGVLLGGRLADSGIQFSDVSGNLFLATFFTSALLYPVRYSSIKLFNHSYFRQKAFDLALAMSGFMLMVNAGNTKPELTASFVSMINPKGQELQGVNLFNNHSPAQKQLVYYQDKQQLQDEQVIPQKEEMSRGTKILLTVLAVLGGLILAFLLAAAACGLSCNGLEGLAYIVGIGGGALLIGLVIWVIKSIWHPKRTRRIKPSEGTNPMRQESAVQI
jgi:hypothetical protein